MHRLWWVSVAGLGLGCVRGLGDWGQGCVWLQGWGYRDGAASCEGSSWEAQDWVREPQESWGSFRAQLRAWLTLCWVLAPGVLRLKPEALAHASAPHLRLLPQQRYLQSERADTSVLERKRNVLCCLITRILKVEKQLHIDNLVFRVRRA